MGISRIWSTNSTYNTTNTEDQSIKTTRLNLFIGPNNSGKSRLLRQLFSTSTENLRTAFDDELKNAADFRPEILSIIEDNDRIQSLNCCHFRDIIGNKTISIQDASEAISTLGSEIHQACNKNLNVWGGGASTKAFNDLKNALYNSELRAHTIDTYNNLQKIANRNFTLKRQYIPILRGMRPLDSDKDAFLDRTLKDYFKPISSSDKLNIITGFDLYNLLVQFLLGQPENRERVREYEIILGNEFFGGATVTLIPEYGKDTVSVKIGDDDQFPIYDLGDGMQQVIIITSAAYLERENSLFFIEEPEACLHPGLLRKLALFLLNHTNHQYFATTHSNHLLDLAELDKRVTIQKVTKTGSRNDSVFSIQECTRDRQLLTELGVLASSIYLSNSTIWVEGITDRLYLKTILEKYINTLPDQAKQIKYQGLIENFHYSFVEYQGGTLGHWAFDDDLSSNHLNATSLCSSAFLIADGDIKNKGDRAAVLEAQLGLRFHLLDCKEFENLLPREIILKAARQIFDRKRKTTTEGIDPELLERTTHKISNSNHGIGYLLDQALGLPGKGKSARRIFADESGTINDKVKFCQEAISVMSSTEWDLTPQLTKLCEEVLQHVLKHNNTL